MFMYMYVYMYMCMTYTCQIRARASHARSLFLEDEGPPALEAEGTASSAAYSHTLPSQGGQSAILSLNQPHLGHAFDTLTPKPRSSP